MYKVLTVTLLFSQFAMASTTKKVVRAQLWYGGIQSKKEHVQEKPKSKKMKNKVPGHLLRYIQKI